MHRRRQRHPTPVLLPGKSHGRRSLEGRSPWGRWGSDPTERLHFHFSLSCIGEGNGNLLQCSCLENPRDGEAWWAAVYGVAWSRTRLKWLSSSNRSSQCIKNHDAHDLQLFLIFNYTVSEVRWITSCKKLYAKPIQDCKVKKNNNIFLNCILKIIPFWPRRGNSLMDKYLRDKEF